MRFYFVFSRSLLVRLITRNNCEKKRGRTAQEQQVDLKLNQSVPGNQSKHTAETRVERIARGPPRNIAHDSRQYDTRLEVSTPPYITAACPSVGGPMFSIACRNMLHAASSHSFRHRIGLAITRLSISRTNNPLFRGILSAYANHGLAPDDISKRRGFATSLALGIRVAVVNYAPFRTKEKARVGIMSCGCR